MEAKNYGKSEIRLEAWTINEAFTVGATDSRALGEQAQEPAFWKERQQLRMPGRSSCSVLERDLILGQVDADEGRWPSAIATETVPWGPEHCLGAGRPYVGALRRWALSSSLRSWSPTAGASRSWLLYQALALPTGDDASSITV